MDSEDIIFKRMKTNRKKNTWWLNIFIKIKGESWLKTKGLTPQAIGVWINSYTSNQERFRILKSFVKLKSK